MSTQTFTIQDYRINIQGDPLVFYPSPHGTHGLGKNIKVKKGESVLDIGTGTGVLAILAAKMGGKVLAVDILKKAIECAKQNMLLNKVNVDIRQSNLFQKVPRKKFDVIIANVPQELLSPKIIKSFKKEVVIGMYGQGDGSFLLKRVLSQAKEFMKPTSRLYVVVYTMSGWRKSLRFIFKNYDAKLLDFYSGKVKDFVYKDLAWYKNKPEIGIYDKNKKCWADLFVFELKIKSL